VVEDWLKHASAYPHWAEDTLRFGDSDLIGHINTASYVSYCDTARQIFCYACELMKPSDDKVAVVVRTAIDLWKELFPPGRIQIGTGVLRLGKTSLTVTQGLFHENVCVATAETVLVRFSKTTRQSLGLGPELISRLQPFMLRKDEPSS